MIQDHNTLSNDVTYNYQAYASESTLGRYRCITHQILGISLGSQNNVIASSYHRSYNKLCRRYFYLLGCVPIQISITAELIFKVDENNSQEKSMSKAEHVIIIQMQENRVFAMIQIYLHHEDITSSYWWYLSLVLLYKQKYFITIKPK